MPFLPPNQQRQSTEGNWNPLKMISKLAISNCCFVVNSSAIHNEKMIYTDVATLCKPLRPLHTRLAEKLIVQCLWTKPATPSTSPQSCNGIQKPHTSNICQSNDYLYSQWNLSKRKDTVQYMTPNDYMTSSQDVWKITIAERTSVCLLDSRIT